MYICLCMLYPYNISLSESQQSIGDFRNLNLYLCYTHFYGHFPISQLNFSYKVFECSKIGLLMYKLFWSIHVRCYTKHTNKQTIFDGIAVCNSSFVRWYWFDSFVAASIWFKVFIYLKSNRFHVVQSKRDHFKLFTTEYHSLPCVHCTYAFYVSLFPCSAILFGFSFSLTLWRWFFFSPCRKSIVLSKNGKKIH